MSVKEWVESSKFEDDYVALEICADCACWIANGDVPDWLESDDDN